MLVALLILAVWLIVALATVALSAYAGAADRELELTELAPVVEITSAA